MKVFLHLNDFYPNYSMSDWRSSPSERLIEIDEGQYEYYKEVVGKFIEINGELGLLYEKAKKEPDVSRETLEF